MSDGGTSDPLDRRTSLPHSMTLPVFGHPVTYRTNSRRMLSFLEAWYGYWRRLPPELITDSSFIINIRIREGGDEKDTPNFHYDLRSVNHLVIIGQGCVGNVDVDRRCADAEITTALLEHSDHLRTGLLDTLTLMLVTSIDRCPVHASAVAMGQRLVLLVGASGSGKSTLAYALHRAGFEMLSDDAIYVQLHPEPRIWFHRRSIGLLAGAAAEFSELRTITPRMLSTGKKKVVVPLKGTSSPDPCDLAPLVCILGHGEVASVTPLDADEILSLLGRDEEAGFDRLTVSRVPVLKWLAANGGWQLTLSPRAGDAVPLVRDLLAI